MAGITYGNGAEKAPLLYDQTPSNYTSLGDLIDVTKPDVRDMYIQTFGDQGITGLLDITGAKKSAGTADEVHWYEEGRLHTVVKIGAATTAGTATIFKVGLEEATTNLNSDDVLRKYDVLLSGTKRLLVTATGSSATFTYKEMETGGVGATFADNTAFSVIGNAYPQGSAQPTLPFQVKHTLRKNPFTIVKETFHVNGSQASNIGWVNVGGQNLWYLKGEIDARRKFMNMREAMLVFGQLPFSTGYGTEGNHTAIDSIPGSEGYFGAVENRGIVATDTFAASATFGTANGFDALLVELDAEGAPQEYAMYLDRDTSLGVENILATGGLGGNGIGLAAAYGAFNNDQNMAVSLGFQSFNRGGYTFHKHNWKLLNDPTMGAKSSYKGALIPLTTLVDPKSGQRNPSLEMNYKAAGNYSREMEHWVEGGGVLGYATNGDDVAKFHYRSECNLCVRAANQHVALK
jgi:hypothetical protein